MKSPDKNITQQLVNTAESLFDQQGFNATGMGQLIRATGISSRTVYKHVGSKQALIVDVLSQRQQRFQTVFEANNIDTLFVQLRQWLEDHGARGCLFLRAYAEHADDSMQEILSQCVREHKDGLQTHIEQLLVHEDILPERRSMLAEQLLLVFEGATAAAVYRGVAAVESARKLAQQLLQQARQ